MQLCLFLDSADTKCSASLWTIDRTADICRSHHLQHKWQHDKHDVRPQVVTNAAIAIGPGCKQSAEAFSRLQQTEWSMLDIPGCPWTADESNSVTVSLESQPADGKLLYDRHQIWLPTVNRHRQVYKNCIANTRQHDTRLEFCWLSRKDMAWLVETNSGAVPSIMSIACVTTVIGGESVKTSPTMF